MIYLQRRKSFLKQVILFTSLIVIIYLSVAFFNSLCWALRIPFDLFKNPWWLIFAATLLAVLFYKPVDFLIMLLFQHVLFKQKMDRVKSPFSPIVSFLRTRSTVIIG